MSLGRFTVHQLSTIRRQVQGGQVRAQGVRQLEGALYLNKTTCWTMNWNAWRTVHLNKTGNWYRVGQKRNEGSMSMTFF